MQRLFEIIYILMERDGITARELAQHLEVSTRTILRDVDALSAAGIPVYAARGRGGGIHLMPHFVLNKTLLTSEEQSEILSALQSLQAVGAAEAQKVLGRLSGLFGREQMDWIDVDFSDWGGGPVEKEEFRLIKSAILNRRILQFDYYGTRGDRTMRTIEPYRLSFKSASWYLQGWCLERQDYRTFKIRRMSQVRLTGEAFSGRETPLPEMDSPSDVPALRRISLLFSSQVAFRVLDEFSPDCITLQPDGSYLVETDWPVDTWGCYYFLSFGPNLKVLEPPELKQQILQEIEKIRNHYLK